ncbi:MAG: protein-L-isoaspartate O-methyltransferase, partial [Magnetococcales bacterium]|nr:protein-L-isoaspartate O-methyltransferase [Magnetococcales bacterium]
MDYTQARVNMVKSQAVPNMVRDPALLAGMLRIPREAFVDAAYREVAYMDVPVPWSDSGRRSLTPLQTAWLIDALEVGKGSQVLVIGAGSGYEVALLSSMGALVCALESDPDLAARGETLTSAEGVRWRVGPLAEGWSGEEKFDAILVCGAVPVIPFMVLGQLQPEGILAGIIGQAGDAVMRARKVHGGTFR